MSLARILARSPQASNFLARKLRARGFEIEAHATHVESATSPDVEFSIEECSIEKALDRAARDAKWVFIAPGALSDGVSSVTSIPLAPEEAPEEANDAESESAAAPPFLPGIAVPAPVPKPVIEMLSEMGRASEAEIKLETQEPVVVVSPAATIRDLVKPVEISDPVAVNDSPVESNERWEPPGLLEPPVLAAAMASNLEEPAASIEVPAEEPVAHAELEAVAVAPVDQPISDIAAQPALALESSVETPALPVPPAPPEPQIPEPLQVAPRLTEKTVEVREEKTAIAASPAKPLPRRIRIVLPGFKKNAYFWAGVMLTTGVLGLVLIYTKPVLRSAHAFPRSPQTSVQIKNAPASSTKPSAPGVTQPQAPAPHPHSAPSDEGYIAKDTVVRYGSSGAPPLKKSAAKAKSIQK